MTQGSAALWLRTVRVALLVALGTCGMVTAFATMAPSGDPEVILSRTTRVEPLEIAIREALLPAPQRYVREEEFRRGDTLAGFLARLSIAEPDLSGLLAVAALRGLRPGTDVLAEVSPDGRVFELSFLGAQDRQLTLHRAPEGFEVKEGPGALQVLHVMRTGIVRSSLFAATDAADVPDNVAIQLAEIFSTDVDFHRDLRRGDRFTIVYEMLMLSGRPVRTGRVLAAEFVNQGKPHRAIYFTGSDGKGAYYTPSGKSLRKAFLRSPLEFSRISSGFGLRMHPFLNSWRAHKGVDYAAPAGTRVRAVSDGFVEFAGRQGGYGNMLVLRHAGSYTTAYAHLSSITRGLTRGMRVAQGETIGYVGQTGWATGPHLHYEFRVAGEPRNPLAVALPVATPIPQQSFTSYLEFAAPLLARLDLLAETNLAALYE
jgi:murein DD-endopeptidase MepM/ murein hydrolase activator NlpD